MIVPNLPAPYTFAAARHTPVSFGIKKWDVLTQRSVDFNISGSRYSVHLRAWDDRDSSTLVIDGTISKSSDNTAWVDGTLNPGDDERATLYWEAVLVDSDNANADSPSGYLERQLFTFQAPVEPAPTEPAT